jgi:DNA repair exonuclease SbcCD ATPase subunit
LKAQLVIIQSELDLYRAKSKEAVGQDTENRFLKDKVEELKSKLEKVKNSKENLMTEKNELEKNKMKIEVELQLIKENIQEMKQKVHKAEESKLKIATELKAKEMLMKKHIDEMKSSYKSSNDVIIQARNTNSNITIYVNEMKQEMKDYAISHSSKALKSFNDIKSIAESNVNAFNERYGKSWHCLIGENIAHNSLYHDIGSYLSFSIEDLKIILYKTSETVIKFKLFFTYHLSTHFVCTKSN